MDGYGSQKRIEEETLLGTSFESGEFEVILLSLEDSLSRSSVVICILPFLGCPGDRWIQTWVVLWMRIYHSPIVRRRTCVNKVTFQVLVLLSCFDRTSPLDPVPVSAIAIVIHLVTSLAYRDTFFIDG